ncbi:hypothetical protein [Massilia sp. CMS3.1]|uniref:hypothetical protein n=1 Tax=Massilia sp. CMS3.1 TaxID=3373083 RepID=UPI003F4C18CD
MFDTGTRRGDSPVALLLRVGDRLGRTAFALDLDAPASRCQRCLALGNRIATVGVDVAAGVATQTGLRQPVAEQPDRLGIGDRAALGKTEKLQETASVEQLLLACVVGQIVELLQYQNFGHQDRGVRRPATFGTRWTRQGGIDFVGQCGKVDMLAQAGERIAKCFRQEVRRSHPPLKTLAC